MRPARQLNLVGLLLSGLLLCGAHAHAQNPAPPTAQPQAPAPTPTETPLNVRLTVLVFDRQGAPVGALRAEDFQVFEDGTAQAITSFTHEQLPASYVLLMDNSSSMKKQLELTARAAATVAAGNGPGDETAVIRFVDSDLIEVSQPFTAEPSQLLDALRRLHVEGGQSAVIDAVFLAAHYVAEQSQRDANRHRALVLVSDGEDRDSYYKLAELLKYLRATDVQVFIIGLVMDLDDQTEFTRPSQRAKAMKLLDTLAAETGGRVFYPKKIEEVRDAVAAIRAALHTQYVIGYTSTNQRRDTKHRKLQVKLADKPGAGPRTVIARNGYVAIYDAPASEQKRAKQDKKTP
ncbi:MAG TPA: VWA domain-containing protein [Pyrinomonadaceae bacterium]|jgi:Ca-activated chloride channel family protein